MDRISFILCRIALQYILLNYKFTAKGESYHGWIKQEVSR